MDTEQGTPKKRSILPVLVGLVLMSVLGGGGFWATYSGMLHGLFASKTKGEQTAAHGTNGYVALDPLIISIGANGDRHLRFAAQLEVPETAIAQVESLKPRIADIMNSYLRALGPEEITDPNALIRLRAQMLRRVRIITGDKFVTDLLISEFILS